MHLLLRYGPFLLLLILLLIVLPRLVAFRSSFWFGWKDRHPATRVYEPPPSSG